MAEKVIELDERLKAHFLNLYQMVIADNDIDPKELETLYSIGLERGVTAEEINKMVLSEAHPIDGSALSITEKIQYLHDLARIAWADGKIVNEERELIGRYITKFGFPQENVSQITDYFIKAVKEGKTVQDIINELN